MKKYLFIVVFLSFQTLFSQETEDGIVDTLIYIEGNDTIREIVIEEVLVERNQPKLTKEEKEQIKLLQRRVRVVYPYAKITSDRLTQINATMTKLKSEKEKKKYFKLVEKYLTEEFEPKLKKLSTKQGQILVKLIYRQTGLSTFDLIKDYKSGWKAFWSSKTAKLFNIDLKKKYDPLEVPEDYYIEMYLLESFEAGTLQKQDAKKPYTVDELYANWVKKNAKKKE